jgi:phosphoribosylpyrophosphate synthetase
MMTVANDRARVAQNDETIENLKRNRRQDKQIDRRDAVDPTAMNIFDTRPDPSYGTGAIVYFAEVNPMPKAANKWNTYEIDGQTPVLVDDIISSGRTMIEAVRLIVERGAQSPICVAVHGLFAEDSDKPLARAGARVVTSNSIPHATNGIDVAEALVPTANPKPLTATANRLILAPDERSWQIDLVRPNRTVPVTGCVGSRDPCPSTPTQRAAAQIP